MFENVNIHDILKFGDYVGNPRIQISTNMPIVFVK